MLVGLLKQVFELFVQMIQAIHSEMLMYSGIKHNHCVFAQRCTQLLCCGFIWNFFVGRTEVAGQAVMYLKCKSLSILFLFTALFV